MLNVNNRSRRNNYSLACHLYPKALTFFYALRKSPQFNNKLPLGIILLDIFFFFPVRAGI